LASHIFIEPGNNRCNKLASHSGRKYQWLSNSLKSDKLTAVEITRLASIVFEEKEHVENRNFS
jgi:hypothetical protein